MDKTAKMIEELVNGAYNAGYNSHTDSVADVRLARAWIKSQQKRLIETINNQTHPLTKEKFEKRYAERSGVTVEWLRNRSQFAVPCDCKKDGCQGWQMINSSTVKDA